MLFVILQAYVCTLLCVCVCVCVCVWLGGGGGARGGLLFLLGDHCYMASLFSHMYTKMHNQTYMQHTCTPFARCHTFFTTHSSTHIISNTCKILHIHTFSHNITGMQNLYVCTLYRNRDRDRNKLFQQ